jgi:hypothetical protein
MDRAVDDLAVGPYLREHAAISELRVQTAAFCICVRRDSTFVGGGSLVRRQRRERKDNVTGLDEKTHQYAQHCCWRGWTSVSRL